MQFLALIFVVFAFVAVAGCGDNDGDAATSSDTTSASSEPASDSSATKAQFLKEASDICIREREKLAKEALAFGKRAAEKDPGVLEHEYFPSLVLEVVLPSIRRQLAQLHELEVPAGDEQKVEKIFASLQKTIDEEAANPAPGSDLFRERFNAHRRRATKYGLSTCVYP